MQYKQAILLALASFVAAQDTPSLTDLLSSQSDLSTLTELVSANPELLAALGSAQDITILAPSNAAFEEFLASEEGQAAAGDRAAVDALLQYHVLNGTFRSDAITETAAFVPTLLTNPAYTNVTGGQVVSAAKNGENVVIVSGAGAESTVSTADVAFTGGVVHVIDSVLTIPGKVSEAATAAELSSLVDALTTTELVSAVDETPDVTIFAPTNEAFAEIQSAIANASVEDISAVLTYHVIAGTVGYSSVLESGAELETLNGESVTITIDEAGAVFVNEAQVVVKDVLVANGVVHVIDAYVYPSLPISCPRN
ncbi:beta-Ig-H3/fasciclin [Sporormia fimetaria CBS 119925]|uniref:Beta-Ig-H3/fasciclin n=1 Tax=Sporormia fimetaria CBS 119925 TaxID=1340428 RepID=A0A6A6VC86_9PLEO|nr:beta-Ig-H3/fasciclin [Sporormia fimetaria CBS 119925]